MKIPFTVAVLIMVAISGAKAEPRRYLCIAEKVAGLHYDKQNKAWKTVEFAPGAKYLLRHVSNIEIAEQEKKKWGNLLKLVIEKNPKVNWFFSEFGNKDGLPIAVCEAAPEDFPIFLCHIVFGANSVAFDPRALRFEIARHGSYVAQGILKQAREKDPSWPLDPEKADDLSLEIGVCNAL